MEQSLYENFKGNYQVIYFVSKIQKKIIIELVELFVKAV